jgi:phosphate transport system substrate-binding protein
MEQVFLALAGQVPGKDGKLIPNPYKNWSDIDKSLPN